MAIASRNLQSNVVEPATGLETAGHLILRYGLVLVVGWIGAMKFTAYEAAGIQPLVANSPFMGWMYRFLSVRLFSDLLGIAASDSQRPDRAGRVRAAWIRDIGCRTSRLR